MFTISLAFTLIVLIVLISFIFENEGHFKYKTVKNADVIFNRMKNRY